MNLALHMRISSLSPTDDEVNSRRDASATLAVTWAKVKTAPAALERAQLVAAALTSDEPPAGLAAEVESAVQVHSSSFLASARPFDVGICAATAVSSMMEARTNADGFSVVDILATCLWSALSFQPQLQDAKREAMRAEVLEKVRTRALAVAEQARERSSVDDFAAFSIVEGDEAKTGANFKKATGDTVKALRRNAALDREEIDFLWWTLVARSRLLKKPLHAIEEPVRAVVAGIEAAQFLRRLPCEVHRELVLRSINANASLNLAGLLTAVGESRDAISAGFAGTAYVSANPLVFPLLNALATGNANGDGSLVDRATEDWGARGLLEAGILRLVSTGPALL